MSRDWIVPCIVVSVTDGDSVWVDADLGWHLTLRTPVRVAHINAPETSTDAGKAARDYARLILPVGRHLILTSHSLDKYGRSLGTLTFATDGMDYGALMIDAGHAVPYEGGAR